MAIAYLKNRLGTLFLSPDLISEDTQQVLDFFNASNLEISSSKELICLIEDAQDNFHIKINDMNTAVAILANAKNYLIDDRELFVEEVTFLDIDSKGTFRPEGVKDFIMMFIKHQ